MIQKHSIKTVYKANIVTSLYFLLHVTQSPCDFIPLENSTKLNVNEKVEDGIKLYFVSCLQPHGLPIKSTLFVHHFHEWQN